MATANAQAVAQVLQHHEAQILGDWLTCQRDAGALLNGRISDSVLAAQCAEFLRRFTLALSSHATDVEGGDFAEVRELLTEMSRSRAVHGFSPRETAVFVFSLKQPLFNAVDRFGPRDAASRLEAHWTIGLLLDALGLLTIEVSHKRREELILRQQQEISELSTPVIKLWEGILALPLIGTLDSQRAQVVMENLLESIVRESADIAIIDITGVPTVDTLTAQHVLKTVAAARLMGADCIISGIRPQIAQTMVQLGVEFSVISKATLADAFALALQRRGRCVQRLPIKA